MKIVRVKLGVTVWLNFRVPQQPSIEEGESYILGFFGLDSLLRHGKEKSGFA